MTWLWKMQACCITQSIVTTDRAGHLGRCSITLICSCKVTIHIEFTLHRDKSLSVEQLQHLTVQQALADLAHFIRYQKSSSANLTQSRVILVGGSYSGSMAAWMTQLYPELITASWASSAPLIAKADFYGKCSLFYETLRLYVK